jgi:Tfp pilus assembly protein PilF
VLDSAQEESKTQNRDTLASILLIVTVVGLVAVAWGSPSAQGYYEMRRAETLLVERRYSQAQTLLEQTLPIYDSPQIRLDLSYAYLARRDAVRAERQARIALADAPPYLRTAAWAQLGRVLSFAGRDAEALDAWAEAQKAATPYNDIDSVGYEARSALWHSAMTHWSQADWVSARSDLEKLSSGTDIYAMSARVRLIQLLAPAQHSVVLPSTGDINAIPNPQSPIPQLNVPGLSEGLSVGEMEQVIADLSAVYAQAENAAQNGSGEAEISTIWGGSYLQQGENRLAREYLEGALAFNPDYEPAHARLALALLNLGDEQAASQHMDTAVRLDASDPLPHHLLARLHIQQSDWVRAEEQLTILRKLEPSSVEVHLQWAEYYRLQGEYDKAENEYIDAANLQISGVAAPSGTNAPLILAHFYTDVRGFGCEKGLPAARQSLALHPNDPASFDAIGWALMLCKQPRDALSGLEEAVKAAPDVPRYRLHLAKIYSALGRYADAREQYGWVLDLDPGGLLERPALDDLVALPK